LFAGLFSSCTTARKTNYMQKSGISIPSYKDSVLFEEYRLKVGDRLYVRVYSLDDETNMLFNAGNTQMGVINASGAASELYTYLIKDDGTISLPRLGSICVVGLTLLEVKHLLNRELSPYFKTTTPVDVDVRRVQRYYSVLGEGRSGRFPINREKINIFQALAQAGNIGLYGDRSKIKIIRETETGAKVIEFDVRSEDIIHSEYYYIEDNDVIYIQPMTEKMFGITTIGTLFGMIVSTMSFSYMLYSYTTTLKL